MQVYLGGLLILIKVVLIIALWPDSPVLIQEGVSGGGMSATKDTRGFVAVRQAGWKNWHLVNYDREVYFPKGWVMYRYHIWIKHQPAIIGPEDGIWSDGSNVISFPINDEVRAKILRRLEEIRGECGLGETE